jgi:toxin ParE1/3/4
MAYRVDITERAERDFARLYEAIEAEHSGTAKRWYAGLKEAILGLEQLPHRCPVIRKRGQIRQLLYSSRSRVYLVLYRILEKQKLVEVLHLRHGARRRFERSDLESERS